MRLNFLFYEMAKCKQDLDVCIQLPLFFNIYRISHGMIAAWTAHRRVTEYIIYIEMGNTNFRVQ
jgi:hypothetical protein